LFSLERPLPKKRKWRKLYTTLSYPQIPPGCNETISLLLIIYEMCYLLTSYSLRQSYSVA
jgi:hypothetical protein